jgi:hypothetical protein
MILLLVALLQQPAAPTVGDTVWVARSLRAPAGSVVRAAPWPDDATADVQSLGAATVGRRGDSVEIRYPLVIWTPGEHEVDIPGPTILGPGAAIDSLGSIPVTLFIASVLPDTIDPDSTPPRPADGPVGRAEVAWLPLLEFLTLAIALGAGVILFGRREKRAGVTPAAAAVASPDVLRWAREGEVRVALAASQAQLRAEIARAVPAAHPGLAAGHCVEVLRAARPDWPLLELEGLLLALDAERFGAGQGDPDLVDRADAMRSRLARGG